MAAVPEFAPDPARRRVRAAVCRTFGAPPAVEDLWLRAPGAGEVGVRVAACAVCHSDLTYAGGAWGGDLPAVFGHEVAGVVDEVGAGVAGVAPGDHVVVTPIRSCGRCRLCLGGRPALCERRAALARTADSPLRTAAGEPVHQGLRTAGFAERVTVHASQVVPIPPGLDLVAASLLGCSALTGAGAVLRTAPIEPGGAVGVVGLGGVGLHAVQAAVVAGAAVVVGVDPVAGRRAVAAELGATHAVDPPGAAAAALAATGGRGLDEVVVTAPEAAAVEAAVALLADAGTLVVAGMDAGAAVAVRPEEIAERELRIVGSKLGSARPQLDVARLAGLARAGRLELGRLVTRRVPLEDVAEAFAAAAGGGELKVVVVP